jgi:RNA polymerase sigma-70 factor (ECF subfamily)
MGKGMDMPRTLELVDKRNLMPAETACALGMVSGMELLRLKTIARVYARGLPPDVAWDDLLQEALTRIISGARQRPQDLPVVAFVAGIMRSLRAEHWRRAGRRSGGNKTMPPGRIGHGSRQAEVPDAAAGPERSLSAQQELAAIERLFADDAVVLNIIAGLGQGLSAQQICGAMEISATEYDTARRRMRRTLLREGLTCEPKK